MKNYFHFIGVIGRVQYLQALMVSFVLCCFGILISAGLGKIFPDAAIFISYLIIFAVVIPASLITIAASIKRTRDIGISLWWLVVLLIPIANAAIGIFLLLAKSNKLMSDPMTTPGTYSLALTTEKIIDNSYNQVPIAIKNVEVEPDEEFWAQALRECESGAMKAGLWARAFADADGVEPVAKATYIRLRAMQLQMQYAENQQTLQRVRDQERQVEQEKQAAQEAEVAAVLAKMNEDERAKAMLPKGRCPACDAVIPLESEECPLCAASFSEDSEWKVKPLNRYEAIAQTAADNATLYSLQTKKEKESESVGGLIFLGVLLLFVVVAAANA
jgi:uncharacterized membrane protein YhaH (DUF805 family)